MATPSCTMPTSSIRVCRTAGLGVRKGIAQRTVRTSLTNPCETKRNGVSHGWYDNPITQGGLTLHVWAMTMTLIGYARCSTDKQDLAAQRAALEQLGVAPNRIYTDHGLIGTKRSRPGLDQALAAVRTGDTLVVPKLDRLARSVPDARCIADALVARGVRLALGSSVYDPVDPMGKMDGCSNGAASLWNGTTWGGSSLNHLWEGNHIHGSGTSGSSANHQMYLQAWGQVVQFNRIDQIASGAAGANLKSRGIQDIIRYNYFGDGPARDLDLVDVVDAAQFMSFSDFLQNNAKPSSSTYSMDLLAAWQEAWNSHFAYGNIYLNSTATAPIHFSYDESAGETARKGNLFWYNNTFYQEACLACTNQLWTMFDTSAGDGTYLPQTEFQAVQALNNVLWMDSTTQPAFQWNNFDALIGLGTSNLLPANWGTNTMLGGVGDGWNVTANPFAYQNAGTLSLHISGFGTSDVQTSSAIPFDKTSWILANAALGDTSLPSPVCAMPTRFSYLPSLGYAVARTSPPNLGATDTAPQASATLSLVGGARRPAAASTICH